MLLKKWMFKLTYAYQKTKPNYISIQRYLFSHLYLQAYSHFNSNEECVHYECQLMKLELVEAV